MSENGRLELLHIIKKYGRNTVLNDVSIVLKKGCYGLLGPNGAGKTTLIQCALGITKMNKGSIVKNDIQLIGYLPQRLDLFENATVNEMLYYFATIKKIKKEDREQEINHSLEQVNLLERKNDKIKNLSGGMKQRIGIAQAILGEVKVIMLDEPTVGLDPEERKRFKELILQLKKTKIVLISSHIVSDLEEVCDRVIIMNNGKILRNEKMENENLEEYYLEIIKGASN